MNTTLKGETHMWIALIGDPMEGFMVFGPFADAKAIHAASNDDDGIGDDYWHFPLVKPVDPSNDDTIEFVEPLPADVGYDPNGTAVVFGGDLTDGPWLFYGPFRDLEAARHWCAADGIGSDCAIELLPVPVKEAA
jgi:hypothetical protein